MKIYIKYKVDTGEIIGWSSGDTEHPGEGYIAATTDDLANKDSLYVKDGKLCEYTAKHLTLLASLEEGMTWNPLECSIEDTRTYDQKLQAILQKRANAYPDVKDLADAVFWSTQGDNSKMEAWIEQCKQVKEAIPKEVDK